MDNALAIIGLYFTLIGFISGLFFTRLDSWYGDVREFAGGLDVLINKPGTRDQFSEARIKMNGLASSSPSGSFITVGVLLSGLMTLSFFVPVDSSVLNPVVFIQVPLVVTVLAYWIGGSVILVRGKGALQTAEENISESLKG